jgi:thioredoxin 1
MSLTPTTDASFAADVLASPVATLVDFTAGWCPPCQEVAPVLEQIAADQGARLRVVSIDVDDNPVTATLYEVQKLPTLALFVGGRIVARVVGARAEPMIMGEFGPYLELSSETT